MANPEGIVRVNDGLSFKRPLIESSLKLYKNVTGKPRGDCSSKNKVRIVKNSDDTSRTFVDDDTDLMQVTSPDCFRETGNYVFRRFHGEEGGSFVKNPESYMWANPGNTDFVIGDIPTVHRDELDLTVVHVYVDPNNATNTIISPPVSDDFGFLDPTTIDILMQPFGGVTITPDPITGSMIYTPLTPTVTMIDFFRFTIKRDDGVLVTVNVNVRVIPM